MSLYKRYYKHYHDCYKQTFHMYKSTIARANDGPNIPTVAAYLQTPW